MMKIKNKTKLNISSLIIPPGILLPDTGNFAKKVNAEFISGAKKKTRAVPKNRYVNIRPNHALDKSGKFENILTLNFYVENS